MSDNQQRMIGYFIEEAKEHLATIEQGLVDLNQASQDSETIQELFRAAHSVKGGGAMLGYSSIQKTAHRLEDAFKVFRDGNVKVDEQLESLFLAAFDVLQDFITRLETEGLTEAQGQQLLEQANPTFEQLQQHLDQCTDITPVIADLGEPGSEGESKGEQSQQRVATKTETETEADTPLNQLRPLLREMLDYFRGEDTADTRQKLRTICDRAKGVDPNHQNWQTLVDQVKSAVSNPKHSFETLASVVIKDLKQGGDNLELEQPDQIETSNALKRLAEAGTPQVLIPAEPKAAAESLQQIFNQQQLSELKQQIGT